MPSLFEDWGLLRRIAGENSALISSLERELSSLVLRTDETECMLGDLALLRDSAARVKHPQRYALAFETLLVLSKGKQPPSWCELAARFVVPLVKTKVRGRGANQWVVYVPPSDPDLARLFYRIRRILRRWGAEDSEYTSVVFDLYVRILRNAEVWADNGSADWFGWVWTHATDVAERSGRVSAGRKLPSSTLVEIFESCLADDFETTIGNLERHACRPVQKKTREAVLFLADELRRACASGKESFDLLRKSPWRRRRFVCLVVEMFRPIERRFTDLSSSFGEEAPEFDPAARVECISASDQEALELWICALDEDERRVLHLRYSAETPNGECMSFPDIAQKLGVSEYEVKKVHERALRKLRRRFDG